MMYLHSSLSSLLAFTLIALSLSSASAQTNQIQNWIRNAQIPLTDNLESLDGLDPLLEKVRVVGLGEATHGQHEFFELKRRLTMYLIRRHGFRYVAYEASVSRTIVANEFVAGSSSDLNASTRNLGMLIWNVEENARLLADLREWNKLAGPNDQVRLIGVDAQDVSAAQDRLCKMIPEENKSLIEAVQAITPRAQSALGEFMAGKPADWQTVIKDIEQLGQDLAKIKSKSVASADYELCLLEYLRSLTMYATSGSRDEAMAELLLKQLSDAGPKAKCVIWAHNAHLQHSALRYLGSEQMAMGGHLAKALGEGYYAIGFVFGKGEFQANARTEDNRWGFRRYRLSKIPTGSLEQMLGCVDTPAYLLDLRNAPKEEAVVQWLDAGHGQRWFGGYNVPDDCDERTQDASQLLPTYPRKDFDCLLYVAETTAAKPLDASLILSKP